MTAIRSIPYKESRLYYFKRKAAKCRKTLWWWQWQKPGKQYDAQTIQDMCSELGREISYLDDVVDLLERTEVELKATGRVDIAPGPDSIRTSAAGVADKREGVAHD